MELSKITGATLLAVGFTLVLMVGRILELFIGLDNHSELHLVFEGAVLTTMGLIVWDVHHS